MSTPGGGWVYDLRQVNGQWVPVRRNPSLGLNDQMVPDTDLSAEAQQARQSARQYNGSGTPGGSGGTPYSGSVSSTEDQYWRNRSAVDAADQAAKQVHDAWIIKNGDADMALRQAQQAWLQTYQTASLTLQAQGQQNQTALGLLGLGAQLNGPSNYLTYLRTIGNTPGGLKDVLNAVAGRYRLASSPGETPGSTYETQSLQTLLRDFNGGAAAGAGAPGAAGAAPGTSSTSPLTVAPGGGVQPVSSTVGGWVYDIVNDQTGQGHAVRRNPALGIGNQPVPDDDTSPGAQQARAAAAPSPYDVTGQRAFSWDANMPGNFGALVEAFGRAPETAPNGVVNQSGLSKSGQTYTQDAYTQLVNALMSGQNNIRISTPQGAQIAEDAERRTGIRLPDSVFAGVGGRPSVGGAPVTATPGAGANPLSASGADIPSGSQWNARNIGILKQNPTQWGLFNNLLSESGRDPATEYAKFLANLPRYGGPSGARMSWG